MAGLGGIASPLLPCTYSDTLTQVKYVRGKGDNFIIAGKRVSQKQCFIDLAAFDTSATPIHTQKIKIKSKFSLFSEFTLLGEFNYLVRCTNDIDSSKGYYAILDTALNILSQGEYDSNVLNKSKENYITNFEKESFSNNYSVAAISDSFSYKNNKFTKNNSLNFKLRAVKTTPLNFPNIYQYVWEMDILGIQNITQAKFINTNQEIQMLWIVGEANGEIVTQLILFNSNNGYLIKKINLTYLENPTALVCSNYLICNNSRDIIVAGNYFVGLKSWRQVLTLESPTGWFALRFSYNGDTVASIFSNKLVNHQEIGINQTLIVRSITEDMAGNIELISECYSKRIGQTVKSQSNKFVLNAISHYRLSSKLILQPYSTITSVTHFQGVDLTTSLNNDNKPLEFQDVLLNKNVKPFLWVVLDCGKNIKKCLFYSKTVPVKYFSSTGKVFNLETPQSFLSSGNVMFAKAINIEYVLVMWRVGDVYCFKKEVW